MSPIFLRVTPKPNPVQGQWRELKLTCKSTPLHYIYPREYWMVYSGPGFRGVVWFGSSPPSPVSKLPNPEEGIGKWKFESSQEVSKIIKMSLWVISWRTLEGEESLYGQSRIVSLHNQATPLQWEIQIRRYLYFSLMLSVASALCINKSSVGWMRKYALGLGNVQLVKWT